MKTAHPVQPEPGEFTLNTEEFAAKNLVRPQTVRKSLCQAGHYMGIQPRKLKNRRLAWPDIQVG
jgi:hypothetical protein